MVQLNLVPAEFASASGNIQVMPQQGRSVLSTASRHIAAEAGELAAAAWGCQRSSDDPRRTWYPV